MAKIITPKEAAELFFDNCTVATAAFGLAGWPEETALEVVNRFKETGHPAGITHIHAAGIGDWINRGEEIWAIDGLMTRLISSHIGSSPGLIPPIGANKIATWNLPLGTICQIYKEAGRRSPGLMSKVGLGTYIDPRVDGGMVNEAARKDGAVYVDYIPDFKGSDYLFYHSFKPDIGFMRGTTADENGNVTCEKEALNLEMLSVAQMTKANGGIVIVQVESVAKAGSLNPKLVKVPGIYVDYIVQAEKPELFMQTQQTYYSRSFSGEVRIPMEGGAEKMPFDEKKALLRRVACEIKAGDKVNCGIGLPTFTGAVLAEEGCDKLITLISESGSIGGIPGGGRDFGAHYNIEASCDQGEHFTFFDGGGLDVGVFGLSEVDKDGNMNTTLLNGKFMGVGGFANISGTAKHAIIAGTFTAGGYEGGIEDGKVVIKKEGKFKKFVKECPQLSFNADESLKLGNKITFVTERCVIERTEEGMVLTEIAPGIDLQTQILDMSEIDFIIPEGGPKPMNPAFFQEDWGGLKAIMEG
jgi:propionate CoA-transferase